MKQKCLTRKTSEEYLHSINFRLYYQLTTSLKRLAGLPSDYAVFTS